MPVGGSPAGLTGPQVVSGHAGREESCGPDQAAVAPNRPRPTTPTTDRFWSRRTGLARPPQPLTAS
eukprot:14848249-Alexandrium_andersonii.AAC.1